MSNRFYLGQKRYVEQLNDMDDSFAALTQTATEARDAASAASNAAEASAESAAQAAAAAQTAAEGVVQEFLDSAAEALRAEIQDEVDTAQSASQTSTLQAQNAAGFVLEAQGYAEDAEAAALAIAAAVPLSQYATVSDANCVGGLTSALATGRPVFIPNGTWKFTGAVTLPSFASLVLAPNAILDFSGAPAGTTLLTATGTEATPVALAADATVKGYTLSVASTVGFVVGGLVRVCSNALFDAFNTDSEIGEINRVQSIGVMALTLETPLQGSYLVADGATVSAITPVTGIRIRGGTIKGGGQGKSHKGMSVLLGQDIKVEDTKFLRTDDRGVWVRDTLNVKVFGCWFEDFHHSNTAYGVSFDNACQDCEAIGNTFIDVRHSLSTNNSTATKGIPRRILFAQNTVNDSSTSTAGAGGDAIDTHGAAEDIHIRDNVVQASSGVGINFECRSGSIVGNVVLNTASDGIKAHNESDYQGEVFILGNRVRDAGGDGIQVVRGIRGTLSQWSTLNVCNNEVINPAQNGIYINTPRGVGQNNAVTVTGNTVVGAAGSGASIYLEDVVSGAITGNVVASWTNLGASGIRVRDCKDITVTGNTVTAPANATGIGVYVNASSAASATGVSISGNRVIGATPVNLRGIYLDNNAQACTVLDNDLTGCTSAITAGSGTGHVIQFPSTSIAFTIPSLTAGANSRQLLTLNGAALGDIVEVSFDLDLQGMVLSASVSGVNGMRAQVQNITGSTLGPLTGNLRVRRRRAGN